MFHLSLLIHGIRQQFFHCSSLETVLDLHTIALKLSIRSLLSIWVYHWCNEASGVRSSAYRGDFWYCWLRLVPESRVYWYQNFVRQITQGEWTRGFLSCVLADKLQAWSAYSVKMLCDPSSGWIGETFPKITVTSLWFMPALSSTAFHHSLRWEISGLLVLCHMWHRLGCAAFPLLRNINTYM